MSVEYTKSLAKKRKLFSSEHGVVVTYINLDISNDDTRCDVCARHRQSLISDKNTMLFSLQKRVKGQRFTSCEACLRRILSSIDELK